MVSMCLGPENIGYAAVISSLQNIFIFTVGFFFMGLMRDENAPDPGFGSLAVRNVILWSSLAGITMSYFGLKIPDPLHGLLTEIGMTTLPLSLFTIGLGLYGKSMRYDLAKVGWIAALKMAFIPAVYIALALLFDFKGTVPKAVFLQLAMPPAVLNYVIAREFGLDADLVSRSIVFTTLLLFPLLFVLERTMKVLL